MVLVLKYLKNRQREKGTGFLFLVFQMQKIGIKEESKRKEINVIIDCRVCVQTVLGVANVTSFNSQKVPVWYSCYLLVTRRDGGQIN